MFQLKKIKFISFSSELKTCGICDKTVKDKSMCDSCTYCSSCCAC